MSLSLDLDRNNDVVASWTVTEVVARVVLVRRLRDYPQTLADGTTVLDSLEPVATVTDSKPARGKINYYRIFIQNAVGDWLDTISADYRGRIMCDPLFEFSGKLYGNLPGIYEECDTNSELKRYLAIIAVALERFRAKQSGLFDLSNPDEIRDDLIEQLAWNMGWLHNRELPVLRQRAEIKRAVEIYRKKGTTAGLIDLIQGIINWNIEIIRYNRNILMTNLLDSTTLDMSDPSAVMNMDSAADTADYIIGPDINPATIKIRIKSTDSFAMFQKVRYKLFRILDLWIPAGIRFILDICTQNDESSAISDWRPEGADTLVLNWLITNENERTLNSPLWRTLKYPLD